MQPLTEEKAGLVQVLNHMNAAGWAPLEVSHNGETVPLAGLKPAEAVEICSAYNELDLLLINRGRTIGRTYLIWGNGPEEIVVARSGGDGFNGALDAAIAMVFAS